MQGYLNLSIRCFHNQRVTTWPIPVAARSKAWVCDLSLAGVAGSNPAIGMDVCLLSVLCLVTTLTRGVRSLRRADHSSRGVLPSVVCLSVISKSQRGGGLGPLGLSSHKKINFLSDIRLSYRPTDAH
jgi:hypothetical protein